MRTDAVTGRAVVIDRDRSRRQGGSTRLLAAMGLTLTLTLPLPLPLPLSLSLALTRLLAAMGEKMHEVRVG